MGWLSVPWVAPTLTAGADPTVDCSAGVIVAVNDAPWSGRGQYRMRSRAAARHCRLCPCPPDGRVRSDRRGLLRTGLHLPDRRRSPRRQLSVHSPGRRLLVVLVRRQREQQLDLQHVRRHEPRAAGWQCRVLGVRWCVWSRTAARSDAGNVAERHAVRSADFHPFSGARGDRTSCRSGVCRRDHREIGPRCSDDIPCRPRQPGCAHDDNAELGRRPPVPRRAVLVQLPHIHLPARCRLAAPQAGRRPPSPATPRPPIDWGARPQGAPSRS